MALPALFVLIAIALCTPTTAYSPCDPLNVVVFFPPETLTNRERIITEIANEISYESRLTLYPVGPAVPGDMEPKTFDLADGTTRYDIGKKVFAYITGKYEGEPVAIEPESAFAGAVDIVEDDTYTTKRPAVYLSFEVWFSEKRDPMTFVVDRAAANMKAAPKTLTSELVGDQFIPFPMVLKAPIPESKDTFHHNPTKDTFAKWKEEAEWDELKQEFLEYKAAIFGTVCPQKAFHDKFAGKKVTMPDSGGEYPLDAQEYEMAPKTEILELADIVKCEDMHKLADQRLGKRDSDADPPPPSYIIVKSKASNRFREEDIVVVVATDFVEEEYVTKGCRFKKGTIAEGEDGPKKAKYFEETTKTGFGNAFDRGDETPSRGSAVFRIKHIAGDPVKDSQVKLVVQEPQKPGDILSRLRGKGGKKKPIVVSRERLKEEPIGIKVVSEDPTKGKIPVELGTVHTKGTLSKRKIEEERERSIAKKLKTGSVVTGIKERGMERVERPRVDTRMRRRLISMATTKNIIDRSKANEFTKTWDGTTGVSWTVPVLGWPTFSITVDGAATVTAGYAYTMKVDLVAELEWDWRTGAMDITFKLDGKAELAAYFELLINAGITFKIEDLLKLGFTFWIPAGPVPISIKPFIGADCEVKFEFKLKFRLECKYERNVVAGMRYKRDVDLTLVYSDKTNVGERFSWTPTKEWNDPAITNLNDCAHMVYNWGVTRSRCRYFDFKAAPPTHCRCMGYQFRRGSTGRKVAAVGWRGYKMRKPTKVVKVHPENGHFFDNNNDPNLVCTKEFTASAGDTDLSQCLDPAKIVFAPKLKFGVQIYYAFDVHMEVSFPVTLNLRMAVRAPGICPAITEVGCKQAPPTPVQLKIGFPLTKKWSMAIVGEINANNLFPINLGIPVLRATGNIVTNKAFGGVTNLPCMNVPQIIDAQVRARCCAAAAHMGYDDLYLNAYDDYDNAGGGIMRSKGNRHDFVGYITDGYKADKVESVDIGGVGAGNGPLYAMVGLILICMFGIFWCVCCVAGVGAFMSFFKRDAKESTSYQLHHDREEYVDSEEA